jgi:sec-independent protein translocase protein TatC
VPLEPTLMMLDYLDFVGQTLAAFGLVFELPLVLTALSMTGLINYLQMYRFGRWFIMIASIVGAIISPPDTSSMIVMTVPLVALYFFSIGLAYIFGVRPTPEQLERDRRWQEDKKREAEERKRLDKAQAACDKADAAREKEEAAREKAAAKAARAAKK